MATKPINPLARDVYLLLVPEKGMTVLQLATQLQVNERTAREAASDCSILAAVNSSKQYGFRIIGYDPEQKLIVDASDKAQAKRIIEPMYSRYIEIQKRVQAMLDAYQDRFNEELVLDHDNQATLFEEGG
jgi:hypothetical protein